MILDNEIDRFSIEPNTLHNNPFTKSKLIATEIEKRIYNICKGNDSVFLHTLTNSSDESDEKSADLTPLSMQEISDKTKHVYIDVNEDDKK